MSYANGYIPASELVVAANGTSVQLLERQTAAQWAAMVAAAAADGVLLRPASEADGVSSCYRSFGNQQFAKAKELAGGPTAATPGFSNHGLGTAIDIYMGPGVFAWLQKNAARFGFDNVQGKASGENWHWVRTVVVNLTTPAALSVSQLNALTEGESDMPVIVQVTDVKPNPIYSLAPEHIVHITTPGAATTSAAVFSDRDEIHSLTTPQFNAVLASLGIPVNQVYHFGGHPVGYSWSAIDDIKAQLAKVAAKVGA